MSTWVQDRLIDWSDWARGNQLLKRDIHPLAAMIRRAAGEMQGRDLSVPYDLTFELECVDKAVARLRQQNPRYKRLIMRRYMGRVQIQQLARDLHQSEERVKEMLVRAEAQVGRNIHQVEIDLTTPSDERTIIIV